MAVRNFYVEADIDGRQTMLCGGPAAKDGGMDVTIYQRDEGGIKRVLTVTCRARGDKLVTWIDVDGDDYYRVIEETVR